MERQHVERLSGHYENLEATADMYADAEFDGAFKDGKVDLSMGGKLPGNNLDKLMRPRTPSTPTSTTTRTLRYRHTNQFSVLAAPTT